MSSITWLVVAVLGLIAAGAISWFLVQRRRDVWRHFARRHGLRYELVAQRPRIKGEIDGHDIELKTLPRGSDEGVLGFEMLELSVGLKHPLAQDLELATAGGLSKAEGAAAPGRSFNTGDAEFDGKIQMREGRAGIGESFLTLPRRRALLELMDEERRATIGLAHGRLFLQERELVPQLAGLEDQFRRLLAAAARMDQGSRGPLL